MKIDNFRLILDSRRHFSEFLSLFLTNIAEISKFNCYFVGQNQLVKQEADDSDEEEDRKGGMQKEDINKWLQDIENCWAELDRNVDYPR